METFKTSRLSSGNKLFPTEITILERNVVIHNPGLFNTDEKTIPFSKIASVSINKPLIGFSTIVIETTGEDSISITGFTKDQVIKMKEIILENI